MPDTIRFSVDSSPDISHVDPLTIIVRYVLPDGPVERFLTFIDIQSHTGEQLALYLSAFLKKHGIGVMLCRGQTYDNAAITRGQYSGMQAKLRGIDPYVQHVPCAAHSLNLIGEQAVGSCVEEVSFFGLLQQLYNFFAASTSRWKVLKDALPSGCVVPKSQSGTRWSANADAVNAMVQRYAGISTALENIMGDDRQKSDTRSEVGNTCTATCKCWSHAYCVKFGMTCNR